MARKIEASEAVLNEFRATLPKQFKGTVNALLIFRDSLPDLIKIYSMAYASSCLEQDEKFIQLLGQLYDTHETLNELQAFCGDLGEF